MASSSGMVAAACGPRNGSESPEVPATFKALSRQSHVPLIPPHSCLPTHLALAAVAGLLLEDRGERPASGRRLDGGNRELKILKLLRRVGGREIWCAPSTWLRPRFAICPSASEAPMVTAWEGVRVGLSGLSPSKACEGRVIYRYAPNSLSMRRMLSGVWPP